MNNNGYEQRYIAFIDILGFTKHVERSVLAKNRALFSTLRGVLSSKVFLTDRLRPEDIQCHQFSDSIILSTKKDDQGLKEIIGSVCNLSNYLLSYYLLMRGGITCGKLYHDSKAVFGPGLIKAYHIENNWAIYPRILIDHNIYRKAAKVSLNKGHFRKDFDGLYHLDILKRYGWSIEGDMSGLDIGYNLSPNITWTENKWFENTKIFIEESLESQKNSFREFIKYAWLGIYFNDFLKKNKNINIAPIQLNRYFQKGDEQFKSWICLKRGSYGTDI